MSETSPVTQDESDQLDGARAPLPELVIWDADNPRALQNLLNRKIREHLMDHLKNKPEYFNQDEHTMWTMLKRQKAKPNPTDHRLRIKFWMEYEYCMQYHCKSIDISRVVAGVCSRDFFEQRYVTNPFKMAWLITPPVDYMVRATEALDFGMEQLRDLLAYDHKLKNGRADVALGKLKQSIVAMLEARVKGLNVQKSMSVVAVTANESSTMKVANAIVQPTIASIEERLRVIRQENKLAKNGGTFVDSTPVEAKGQEKGSEEA
jgi:hypothetical protein